MLNTSLHFSSATPEWPTPQDFYDKLNAEFGFTLDPCCTHESAKCPKHYTEAEDGLTQDWTKDIAFMNPPYGRAIKAWVKKAYESAQGGGNGGMSGPGEDGYPVVPRLLSQGGGAFRAWATQVRWPQEFGALSVRRSGVSAT
jgi:hypothetical protein